MNFFYTFLSWYYSYRSHHARHHTSGHRQRQQRTPPPQQGSPQQKRSPVHYLNANSYVQLVQGAPKGQLSVVLLINTHDSIHSRPLAQSFWRITEGYATSHVKVCFLCYRAYLIIKSQGIPQYFSHTPPCMTVDPTHQSSISMTTIEHIWKY